MTATKSPPGKRAAQRKRGTNSGHNNWFSGRNRTVILIFVLLVMVVGLLVISRSCSGEERPIENEQIARLAKAKVPDWVKVKLIPKDADSRRGELLEDINNIVIHYVGNPGSTAEQNRSYFSNPGTEVNAHFIVGLEGEVLQCLPLEEKSSATNQRNRDTISIEVCHPDADGKFTQESYESLVKLTAWLCTVSELDENDLIRHYDVTGKECPAFYVHNEAAWDQLKIDVGAEIQRQTTDT